MYAREDDMFDIAGLGCWVVVSLLTLLLNLLYLSSLGKALAACGSARRTLEPGMVWLNLIPVFHLFWKFWTSAQIGASLQKEFDARGMKTGFTFGRSVGILVPLVALLTRFVFWMSAFLSFRMRGELGFLVFVLILLLGVVELILLIVHWVQINGYRQQLNASRPAEADDVSPVFDDGGERDFDEDYRPITRRRRRSVNDH